MAKLTAAGRKRIKTSNFAIPERRAYPVQDISHARNALARSSGKSVAGRVRRAVERRYKSLRKSSRSR